MIRLKAAQLAAALPFGTREQLDHIFHALAHSARREIVCMLAERPHHISEFTRHFAITLAAVSKHVRVLERAGVIERTIKGRRHVLVFAPGGLAAAHQWLATIASSKSGRRRPRVRRLGSPSNSESSRHDSPET